MATKLEFLEGSVAQFVQCYTMAGAISGRLEPFDPDVESIVVYLERVELYFEANEIKAGKRVVVFLNVVGTTH